MNRSEFLKKLGIGIGVAIVAPKVLAELPTEEYKGIPLGTHGFDHLKPIMDMPIGVDGWTLEEYFKYYKRTGDLPYKLR